MPDAEVVYIKVVGKISNQDIGKSLDNIKIKPCNITFKGPFNLRDLFLEMIVKSGDRTLPITYESFVKNMEEHWNDRVGNKTSTTKTNTTSYYINNRKVSKKEYDKHSKNDNELFLENDMSEDFSNDKFFFDTEKNWILEDAKNKLYEYRRLVFEVISTKPEGNVKISHKTIVTQW